MTLADELERLAEKATPGPWLPPEIIEPMGRESGWVLLRLNGEGYAWTDMPKQLTFNSKERDEHLQDAADAALLVALRNNLPAIIAALRAQEWQPIETAPRDGTNILVWVRGECAVAYWVKDAFGKCWGLSTPRHKDDPSKMRTYSTLGPRLWEGMVIDEGPTHWRPLPTPPAHDKGEPKP